MELHLCFESLTCTTVEPQLLIFSSKLFNLSIWDIKQMHIRVSKEWNSICTHSWEFKSYLPGFKKSLVIFVWVCVRVCVSICATIIRLTLHWAQFSAAHTCLVLAQQELITITQIRLGKLRITHTFRTYIKWIADVIGNLFSQEYQHMDIKFKITKKATTRSGTTEQRLPSG